MRAGEVLRIQRFRDNDLAAGRPDRAVELFEQAARVPVGRDHDVVGIELVDCRDGMVLADVGPGLRRPQRQSANPARRVNRRVAGVKNRTVKAAGGTADGLGTPFGLEAVSAQRFVFGAQCGRLFAIGRESQAPGPPEGVPGELSQTLERAFGQTPERRGALGAELDTGDIVRRRTAAQGETAVATARAARHLAGLVHADAQPGVGERERTRTAGHARTDDRHVDPAGMAALR